MIEHRIKIGDLPVGDLSGCPTRDFAIGLMKPHFLGTDFDEKVVGIF